jgi:peptide/nickel transport system substrate-binding protein
VKSNSPALDRRKFLMGLAAGVALPSMLAVSGRSYAQSATPAQGGAVTTVAWPGPTYLNAAITTSGPESFLSPKFFDGLCGYDYGMKPKPALALSWEISEDGLRTTFKLRPDVKWHDGKPFTSKDVAFTFMQVIKVHHGRGRALFADLETVETPDDLTAVFVMNRPAPAMMKALDGRESPIMPRHIYEGTDILQNPANTAPIGTGAFKLTSYERGSNIVMERNPDYWDSGKPHLDQLIIQYIPDPATRTAMFESGQCDIVYLNFLPALDILRLAKEPDFEMDQKGYETSASTQQMDFNLDREHFKDKRVRQAVAHAFDLNWITENIWHGFGKPGASPLHHEQKEFYTTEGVPSYPYDLKKAEALLDEAGYPRGANGVRFELTIDPTPYGEESLPTAEYMREQLRQIGISAKIRTEDYAVFIKRCWTDRDFDICVYTAAMGADPTIGVQRFYWSKNFKPGVAFSNGSHYENPEVDALLEASQIELDPAKRKEQFRKFQQLVMGDLPTLPICETTRATIANKKVKDYTVDALGGALGNMASCWVEA